MLNITRLDSRGKDSSGSAVLDYLRSTEYYRNANGQEVSSSRWLGKGLNNLGLDPLMAVDEKTMLKLAQGFGANGVALVQNAGSDKRRIGYDLTFSADKSISLVFAQADGQERERIINAHHQAVGKAFGFLEGLAETRRGKNGAERMEVSGLVASGHTHFGSRDLDPQLHEHVLLYAVAQGVDGQWASFDPEEIMRHGRAAGALYRAELANQIQQLGFGITKKPELDAFGNKTGEVYFSVAGVTDEARVEFSKRRMAILEYQKEHGGSMQDATIRTRKQKDEPTFAELDSMWQVSIEHMHRGGHLPSNEQLKALPSNVLGMEDSAIISAVHERKAVFSRAELIERIALEHVGTLNVDEILKKTKDITNGLKQSGELLSIAPEKHNKHFVGDAAMRYREERYSAKWMVEMEQQIGQAALKRKDDKSVQIDEVHLAKGMKLFEEQSGFALTAEQQSAVRHVVMSGGTSIITGRAGTGKTTVSKSYVAAFQEAGREVLGASIGWDAAKKLEAESGIPSVSVASMLKSLEDGKLVLTNNHVVVLDEAGMAGTKSIHALQKAIDLAGAKLVLQGDEQQLQPIEAGGAFRLAKKSVGDAKLTDIRRQKDKADIAIANDLYVDAGRAFSRMQAKGQVIELEDRTMAMQALASDYMASATPERDKLALVSTHSDGRKLTKLLRDAKKINGELPGTEYKVLAKVGRFTETLELSQDDRIRFTRRDNDLKIYNGTQGVIERIYANDGGVKMAVRIESENPLQNGRMVEVDTTKFNCLSHGYALTVHKSQGQGKREVYQLANPLGDKHTALVGFTRMKERFALYGGKDDLEGFAKRIGVERLKENAIEAGVTKAPEIEISAKWLERMVDKVQSFIKRREVAQQEQELALQLSRGLTR